MQTMSFEISVDTRALAEKLLAVPHGAIITKAELSEVIGRDITKCRHLLYSAMNLARKEVGCVFGSVRGQGYQRLKIEEVPAIGHAARRSIRSSARRATKKISSALTKANDVSNAVRIEANKELSTLGLIEVSARDANVKPTPAMEQAPLPVALAAKSLLERLGAK